MSIDKLAQTIGRWNGYPDLEKSAREYAADIREAFVVIDRDDLEPTRRHPDDRELLIVGPDDEDGEQTTVRHECALPEVLEREARQLLSLAEYLRKNPPVDEEAVKDAVRAMWPTVTTSEQEYNARLEVARRLIADGWTRKDDS